VSVAPPRRSRRVVTIAIVIASAAVALSALGRPLTYRHGPLRLWSGDVASDQNSQQIADPYTLTHVTHGVGLYALLALTRRRWSLADRLVAAVVLECAWEVFENTDFVISRYREQTIALGYYGDSVVNSIADILAAIVGFALAATLPRRATVAVVLALEVTSLLWIRDSLLLNVLMLVHPSETVKAWQTRGT
jgi:hypothetical protein